MQSIKEQELASASLHQVEIFDTRPTQSSLAPHLMQRGYRARSVPLFRFIPAESSSAFSQVARLSEQGHFDAILYVSRTAIEFFYQVCAGARMPSTQEHWCLGPGSAQALRAQLQANVVSYAPNIILPSAAPWDSENLYAHIRERLRSAMRVLHVRGADAHGLAQGREWMHSKLREHAVQVQEVLAYRRVLQPQPARPGIWLLSSSLSLAALPEHAAAWSSSVAICVHSRIAQRAQQQGFAHTLVASPELSAQIAAIAQAQRWLMRRMC